MLFIGTPQRMVMIGFGGGSIPKSYHRYLPHADIAVIEVEARTLPSEINFSFR
jgi:hypothetical protein